MRREQGLHGATAGAHIDHRLAGRAVEHSDRGQSHRTVDRGPWLVVLVVALAGLLLVGGLLMLLSWVSAGLPEAPSVPCEQVGACGDASLEAGPPTPPLYDPVLQEAHRTR